MKTRYLYFFAAATAVPFVLAASLLEATELVFTVDPASSLTMAADFSGFNLVEQGPGSLSTTYSGTLTVDVDDALAPTSIDFLNGALVAANSGNWIPEAGGGPSGGNTGAAQPANYGGFAATGFLLAGDAYAALRDLTFDAATPGGPLAVTGGSFPSTQTFTITTGTVDFNLEGGAFVSGDADRDDLSADSAVNQATNSIYNSVENLITLTLPIDIDIDISDGDGTANISGTLIATALASFPPGDYDQNGTVGPSDYAVWKASFGSSNQLDADGNGDNVINAADYTVWLDNLNTTTGSGAGSASIPEPNSLILAMVALIFVLSGSSLRYPKCVQGMIA